MGQLRTSLTMAALLLCASVHSPAQTTEKTSIAGAWILNKESRDASPGAERGEPGDTNERERGDRGAGRGGGFGRRGGGGFGRMGVGGGGGGRADPEEMARMRDAMRDLMNPSDHLTITQTDSMIVITSADGRTMRLSPDGKKIKDENTKIERKTKWDGPKLVSEISGLGPGRMTQTFSVDPERHQLNVVVQMEGGRSGQPRTVAHVYDPVR